MVNHVFILAGGSGTRLWPASLKKTPKQFLQLDGGTSLLLSSIKRALQLGPKVQLFIITLEDQVDGVIRECSKLEEGKDRIIIVPEPFARNTAPAISLGVRYVIERYGKSDTVLVLPADHIIRPAADFIKDVSRGIELTEKGLLVTFGIPPAEPATGYGYIEGGEKLGPGSRIASFKEKPDLDTAKKFLQKGNFYWNSGIFLFRAADFWRQLEEHSPGIAGALKDQGAIPGDSREEGFAFACRSAKVREIYEGLPSISIDYAVMEKSRAAGVVPASFMWSDIGSWDEVARLDVTGSGEVFSVDSGGNYVFTDQPVALCGVEDLIVVVQHGAVLICKKGESQKVKQIVTALKEQSKESLL